MGPPRKLNSGTQNTKLLPSHVCLRVSYLCPSRPRTSPISITLRALGHPTTLSSHASRRPQPRHAAAQRRREVSARGPYTTMCARSPRRKGSRCRSARHTSGCACCNRRHCAPPSCRPRSRAGRVWTPARAPSDASLSLSLSLLSRRPPPPPRSGRTAARTPPRALRPPPSAHALGRPASSQAMCMMRRAATVRLSSSSASMDAVSSSASTETIRHAPP